jgi:hypothetical protein
MLVSSGPLVFFFWTIHSEPSGLQNQKHLVFRNSFPWMVFRNFSTWLLVLIHQSFIFTSSEEIFYCSSEHSDSRSGLLILTSDENSYFKQKQNLFIRDKRWETLEYLIHSYTNICLLSSKLRDIYQNQILFLHTLLPPNNCWKLPCYSVSVSISKCIVHWSSSSSFIELIHLASERPNTNNSKQC